MAAPLLAHIARLFIGRGSGIRGAGRNLVDVKTTSRVKGGIRIKVRSNLNGISPRVKTHVARQTDLMMQELFSDLKKLTPVDTGRAKRGWLLRTAGRGARLINRIPYIGVLDRGSSRQAPKGMVEPALKRNSRLK